MCIKQIKPKDSLVKAITTDINRLGLFGWPRTRTTGRRNPGGSVAGYAVLAGRGAPGLVRVVIYWRRARRKRRERQRLGPHPLPTPPPNTHRHSKDRPAPSTEQRGPGRVDPAMDLGRRITAIPATHRRGASLAGSSTSRSRNSSPRASSRSYSSSPSS